MASKRFTYSAIQAKRKSKQRAVSIRARRRRAQMAKIN